MLICMRSPDKHSVSPVPTESVANEAAILARRAGKARLARTEFIEAIEKVMLGERIDNPSPKVRLRRVAFHEGGHALVGEY